MMAAPFSKHSPLRNMMRRITIMSVMVMICFTKTASSGLNLRKKKLILIVGVVMVPIIGLIIKMKMMGKMTIMFK